jgi:GNAT superfamily N-acetyltransferase
MKLAGDAMGFVTKLIARPAPPSGRAEPAVDVRPCQAGDREVDARPYQAGDQKVDVRSYEAGDREGVLGMRVSRHSLYRRFFAGTPRIPAFYSQALSLIDHWDRDALVAVTGTEIVGIAEYTRDATLPGLADLAVMVADPWQRRGIARRLVTDLARLARARGIGELRADVLLENGAARAAMRSVWPHTVAARGEDGDLIYRVPL